MKEEQTTQPAAKNLIQRFPFYYGWIILAAGTLGIIMTSPGQTFTVSIFIEYFIEDLGISRSLISTLYSAGSLISGFTMPFWGRKIDVWGSRKVAVVVSVLFGLSCLFMGSVQNAIMLGVGFILVRMLGQGTLAMVSQTVINQWWVRKRGMVTGISGILVSLLGVGAFPNLVFALIDAFDWRRAYWTLGVILLAGMAPLALLFFRRRPEDFGLLPDGLAAPEVDEEAPPGVVEEESWTLQEAMRTRAFWIFIIGSMLFAMLSTGMFFHLVSIFNDRGLPAAVVATVYVPVSLASAAAYLVGGYITDRIPLKFLLAFGLLLQTTSLIMAQTLQGVISALIFGVILGTTTVISRLVGSIVWPTYYGRQHLGSIYGFTMAAGVVGAALGPLPFGLVRDLTGTYQWVLFLSAAVCFVFSGVTLTVRKPVKKNAKASDSA